MTIWTEIFLQMHTACVFYALKMLPIIFAYQYIQGDIYYVAKLRSFSYKTHFIPIEKYISGDA